MNKVRVPTVYNGGIPLLSDILYPMQDALNACYSLDEEQIKLSQTLLDMWNTESSANLSLRSLLAEGERIAAQSLLMPSDDISSYFFTGDTFDGAGILDPSTTAFLDKEGGFMVLPVVSSEPLNKFIGSINILEESVGRPGDLVTIRNLSFDKKNNPVVTISSDNHDRAEELVDSRPDTYFVWEHVIAPRVQSVRRSGDANAIISDPNGTPQDVKALMGENGLKWSGVIPGQGSIEKDLYTFTNGDKVDTNNDPTRPNLNVSRTAKLVAEFVFVDPVPLSSVRVSPLVEEGLPEPKVMSINATMDSGKTSRPPGLPRRVSSSSGREISLDRATKAGIGRADYNGSGVFFVRTNSDGVKSVRIELQADTAPTKLGVAHQFFVKNTETKEQTHILGLRVRNKTSRGQERISNPNEAGLLPMSTSTGTRNLIGPLGNLLSLGVSYAKDKAAKRQANKKISATSGTPPKDWLGNVIDDPNYTINVKSGEGDTADRTLSNVAGRIIDSAGGRNVATALQQSKSIASTVGSALGGKVGAALLGPYGILIGAALTGNLYGRSRTTRVLSEAGGADILSAQRAAIVLKDISFDARVFAEEGIISSETLTFPGFARAANVFVKVDIPQDWPEGDWITAQIKSIVNGVESEWIDIKPNGTPWMKDPAPETIRFKDATNKVKIRIRVKRPTGSSYQYETPIVSSYAIKGLPK